MAKPTENPVADLLRARGLPSLVIALTHLDAAIQAPCCWPISAPPESSSISPSLSDEPSKVTLPIHR